MNKAKAVSTAKTRKRLSARKKMKSLAKKIAAEIIKKHEKDDDRLASVASDLIGYRADVWSKVDRIGQELESAIRAKIDSSYSSDRSRECLAAFTAQEVLRVVAARRMAYFIKSI